VPQCDCKRRAQTTKLSVEFNCQLVRAAACFGPQKTYERLPVTRCISSTAQERRRTCDRIDDLRASLTLRTACIAPAANTPLQRHGIRLATILNYVQGSHRPIREGRVPACFAMATTDHVTQTTMHEDCRRRHPIQTGAASVANEIIEI